MRFSFDKQDMMRHLMFAKEVVSLKHAMSIMSYILFILKDGVLEIRCTDTKAMMKSTLEVDAQEEGSAVVFLDKLISIITNLPNGQIEYISSQGKTEIIPLGGKKVKFKLNTLSDLNYPSTPALEVEDIDYTSLDASKLKQMIAFTTGSASTDDTRYFLCGVLFEKEGNNLNLVATDGNMLSFCTYNFDFIPPVEQAIVPTKILNIIQKKFSSEGSIDVAFLDNCVYFRQNGITLVSVLVDGKYPNYKRVIPDNTTGKVRLSRSDFLEALSRVGQMVDTTSKRFILDFSQDKITVSSSSSNLGDATEDIEANLEGAPVKMAFSLDKISMSTRLLDDDNLELDYSESTRPIVISNGRENMFHVVMPMHLM